MGITCSMREEGEGCVWDLVGKYEESYTLNFSPKSNLNVSEF
jgi:hypothetical protein